MAQWWSQQSCCGHVTSQWLRGIAAAALQSCYVAVVTAVVLWSCDIAVVMAVVLQWSHGMVVVVVVMLCHVAMAVVVVHRSGCIAGGCGTSWCIIELLHHIAVAAVVSSWSHCGGGHIFGVLLLQLWLWLQQGRLRGWLRQGWQGGQHGWLR